MLSGTGDILMENEEIENENLNPAMEEPNEAPIQRPKPLVDLDVEFVPNNPMTISVDTEGLGQSSRYLTNEEIEDRESNNPGFFKTATEEFKEFGLYTLLRNNYRKDIDLVLTASKGWPAGKDWTSDPSKLIGITDKYKYYLSHAHNEFDLDLKISRVREEMEHDKTLANGSFWAKLVGGIAGFVTDPVSAIPVIGQAKYAKIGPAFFRNAANAAPGIGSYVLVENSLREQDKITGNMQDFLTNSAVDLTFGLALFGTLGVAGLSIEKMNIWNTKHIYKEIADGIDYKLKVNEKGHITGMQAYDKVGGLSAEKVNYAQTIADSQFNKSGIFKTPYLGTALHKFLSLPILGSPLPRLLNDKSKVLRNFVDLSYDHGIITNQLKEGGTSPDKFQSLMDMEHAELRVIDAQINTLFLQAKGFKPKPRAVNQALNFGVNVIHKGSEMLGKDLENSEILTKPKFNKYVVTALRTGKPSEIEAVNEAAALVKEKRDRVFSEMRKAYNMPEEWASPITSPAYSFRVYDKPVMNNNEELWQEVIPGYFKEADELIESRMLPINDLKAQIKDFESKHTEAVEILANRKKILTGKTKEERLALEKGTTFNIESEGIVTKENIPNMEIQPGTPVHTLKSMKEKLKLMKNELQNELRSNKKYQLHVDDLTAFSAKEASELKALLKPLKEAEKKVQEQNKIISQLKTQQSKELTKAKNENKIEKTIPKAEKYVGTKEQIKAEEDKLYELVKKRDEIDYQLQVRAHNGEINPIFFRKEKDSFKYIFRDPKDRLKFRPTFKSHAERETYAKATYDTILHQHPEDTINQIMGKLSGKEKENPLLKRTLLVPDDLLYDNNFMSNDIMANLSNYTISMAKKTHLKNVYKNVTLDGGIEDIFRELGAEYEGIKSVLNARKKEISNKIAENKNPEETKKLNKSLNKIEKLYGKEARGFEKRKVIMNKVYEKMMGIRRYSASERDTQSVIMSLTAMGSLGFTAITMINDLAINALNHGIWPFIAKGAYPMVQSLGGLIKTADSEALRKSARSVFLGFQDVLTGYADKNWSMFTSPYYNLGKIARGVEGLAHLSSNLSGVTYFDNGLQHLAGASVQHELMRILVAHSKGEMTEAGSLYLRKYGIDPEKWAPRMVKTFQESGGKKNWIGGYNSRFWEWGDLEASNQFSKAVFRGIKQTTFTRGLLDSPFWADNIIGSFVHGFKGWMYASINRLVIPTLQQPDLRRLQGILFMLGTGYFVSPLRRLARGEDMFPEDQTPQQRLYETALDSGFLSYFIDFLAIANIASNGRILKDLKNDRTNDRTRIGLLGPAFGKINDAFDVVGMALTQETNNNDLRKLFKMIPLFNAPEGYWIGKKLRESLDIPETRGQAHALKEYD
jgi:hypothetical protein